MLHFLRPPKNSTIPFLTLSAFLIWFVGARLITYYFPNLNLIVGDNHVHHFAYGIVLMSILSYVLVAKQWSYKARLRFAVLVGIALSLVYDEFAMWLTLEDVYYSRHNYDAIVSISLVLLNLVYFPGFWEKWSRKLGKLVDIILLGLPYKVYKRLK